MRGRATADVVALLFAVTVCAVLLLLTVAVTIAGAIPPNDPLGSRYVDLLIAASAAMLGALLGLLAGRTGSADDTQVRPPR